jgi:hypothetical protein
MNLEIQYQRLLVRTFFAYFFAVSSSFAASANVPEELSVCFDFSCKSSKVVNLNADEWQRVSSLFLLNSDADEERDRLKDAVATMEQLMGLHTPTYRDIAKNWSKEHAETTLLSGQMDCIDESLNTTTYLRAMESAGLLKFHRILDRAYRKSLFDQHWAAEIEDLQSGQRYVIDSWFKDNGLSPILVKSERWYDLTWF